VRIDPERVAVEDACVDHRRQEVVRSADRVEIPGQMEVDPLHRRDLGAAAARPAALEPEDGAERRLAQAKDRPLADRRETVGECDSCRRLAFAEACRRERGDQDQAAVCQLGTPFERPKRHLRREPPVELQFVRVEPRIGRHVDDLAELLTLGDLERRRHDRKATVGANVAIRGSSMTHLLGLGPAWIARVEQASESGRIPAP
jgi:hypothetical protein